MERKDGEQIIFPGLDGMLALATPDSKSLMFSIAKERWLIREESTRSYECVLEDQFFNI